MPKYWFKLGTVALVLVDTSYLGAWTLQFIVAVGVFNVIG